MIEPKLLTPEELAAFRKETELADLLPEEVAKLFGHIDALGKLPKRSPCCNCAVRCGRCGNEIREEKS